MHSARWCAGVLRPSLGPRLASLLVQIIPWGDKEALAIKRRQLDVDILVTGHTHKFEHFKHEGKWMLNAGSATGAHSGQHYDVVPGFLLMDVQAAAVTTYVYS